jgi:leucyl aminopeptidase
MKRLLLVLMGLLLIQPLLPPEDSNCGQYDPVVAEILEAGEQDRWMDWIAALSGARPVRTDEGLGWIKTRYSFAMFNGSQSPNAFAYVMEQLEHMGFSQGKDYEIHNTGFPFGDRHPDRNWKNLILTLPGNGPAKDERVLLAAHLDSISGNPSVLAPGADDNASGAAGLLEAAYRLRHFQFDRTIHLIWFTGEEQSRVGSEAFVVDYADWLPQVTGVINLDMFAFDWDEDRCFEIHTGVQEPSRELGRCLEAVIQTYDLNLSYDFIDDASAYDLSDHAPFWMEGVPAVMIFENFSYHGETGCGSTDRNYHYHEITDTLTYINAETGFSILQAAIAAAAHLAGPTGACFSTFPQVYPQPGLSRAQISWTAVPGADHYQIRVWESGQWQLIGTTQEAQWTAPWAVSGRDLRQYQVIAFSAYGCQSLPGEFDPTE